MTPIELATRALIDELHRQGKMRGVAVEDNGTTAQVDGSFPVEPLVRAVVAAIREPTVDMTVIGGNRKHLGSGDMWRAMADQILEGP
ncbi:hypothetical protein CA223_06655 [Sphingomonas koreensis]|uniref:Uncharacterized protein n=1 Tax=Sphingomonas koreensis TaxID=93064 RepID=A0A1L6J8Y0_9SPHN|nr:hypothetical protein [Sphingomonas koreensis]APR52020.1 hypothetical protein BRX40_05830 [Sphingomonas koreensis]RSU22823.1 hypothetical protein CA224_05445 [Sphingomonas koreensis]RSU30703.1 hypothetical protein CA222_01100 [Sphingomonas koreensis]RSU31798.1 hypothetical protein CA225_00180 [Sphingomonas koreensis]RSU39281.1 hypothetical protein BRX39_01350 [Sphingomonas koreensis]